MTDRHLYDQKALRVSASTPNAMPTSPPATARDSAVKNLQCHADRSVIVRRSALQVGLVRKIEGVAVQRDGAHNDVDGDVHQHLATAIRRIPGSAAICANRIGSGVTNPKAHTARLSLPSRSGYFTYAAHVEAMIRVGPCRDHGSPF